MNAVDARWPRLLALAAHELRTPAGVVAGYTRMLLQGRAGDLTASQRSLVEAADRSNARIAELLAQLSDLAHLEEGTTALTPLVVDLDRALAPLFTVSAAGSPPVVLLEPVPPGRLSADVARLGRALAAVVNLHRRKGLTSVALHVYLADTAVWLAIGGGDDARAALPATDAVLEPFNDFQGGLGLDLVLARAILERHGGGLWTRRGSDLGHDVTVLHLPIIGEEA